MRTSLKDLIQKTFILKYTLPSTSPAISKSKISNGEDSCYLSNCEDDIAEVIYNSIIEFAYNDYEIIDKDFDVLHRGALIRKLRYDDDASDSTQLRYGFYGEVLLYCLLHIYYGASPAIARGYFYNILENGEPKGYDAYHLVSGASHTELWFGEVKFYQSFTSATTGPNGAITNLNKALSDDYLNKNLIAILERENDMAVAGDDLKPILNEFKENPEIKIAEISKKHDIKLVYPILILFDEMDEDYDETIRQAIDHIEKEVAVEDWDISIDITLFFILIPVKNAKAIKMQVMQWIKEKKQLMS